MEFVTIIGGIFKFWDQVVWLVKKLEKTPEEKRQELYKNIQAEADNFENTGRPTW